MNCVESEAFSQLELYLIADAIGNYGFSHNKPALPEHIHTFSAEYALNCCRKAFFQGQAIHRFAFERIMKKLQGIT